MKSHPWRHLPAQALATLLLASCTATPGVQLTPNGPVISPTYIDSLGRQATTDWKDAPRRTALDQANLIAMSVDTVLVQPDSLVLAPGAAIPLFGGPLSWVARNRGGETVREFEPWFRVDNARVLAVRGDELVPLAPGRGALLVTAAVRSDSQPPRIVRVTRVRVVVR